MGVVSLIRAGMQTATPWRFELDELGWRDMVAALAHDPLPFAGLWCDGVHVHALFLPNGQPLAVTVALEDGRYPALSPARPVSALYERAIYDLYGAEAMWAVDVRPLLDHDVWLASAPLSAVPGMAGGHKGLVRFTSSDVLRAASAQTASTQAANGQAASAQLDGWGPATGDMRSPLHVALAVSGGSVLCAESQTGYAHRGLALRWRGSSLEQASRLSSRVAARCSVAHQVAFSWAVEAACGYAPDPQSDLVRVALLEIERISHHLYTLADVAGRAGAALLASRCMMLRERILAQLAPVAGSRLLLDVCMPGGIRLRQPEQMAELCAAVVDLARPDLADLAQLWRDYPGLAARLAGFGVTTADELERLQLDGPLARAAGRDCDTRRLLPAYDGLWRYTSGQQHGTAQDRIVLLLAEIGESLGILDRAAARMGLGIGAGSMVLLDGEGTGVVEGPWGSIAYWVRLHDGHVAQVFYHCPAPATLLLFETTLRGCAAHDIALLASSLGVDVAALDG
ncbi:MAG: NADH-quinone oxidoreductase subunit D [Acetobacter sp.]|uniref:NADH-quinone oxidoreductase subunit D-related protein n=1 Tax=Acetobacter sp. TaxID=440 RepID=UPI0039EBB6A1